MALSTSCNTTFCCQLPAPIHIQVQKYNLAPSVATAVYECSVVIAIFAKLQKQSKHRCSKYIWSRRGVTTGRGKRSGAVLNKTVHPGGHWTDLSVLPGEIRYLSEESVPLGPCFVLFCNGKGWSFHHSVHYLFPSVILRESPPYSDVMVFFLLETFSYRV